MPTEIAKAYVQIIPTTKGIKDSLTSELNASGSSAGTSCGNSIASSIKRVIGAAAIGEVIKKSVSLGGELEQNLGGTEVVFGKFASNIQKSAQTAYKNMGTSASDYMATANKMASLFQGSGLEQEKSLTLTTKAMQRAADVASVMGIDTKTALESITGAAKGNFTMMDNLGVAMNATTLQAYALEKGVNFKWDTASNAEKAELAMQMFFEKTEQYAGNFARESSETLSGSFGAVKAALQDTLANLALGENVQPSLTALTETIVAAANNLLPAISNIVSSIPTAVISIIAGSGPQLIESGISCIKGIVDGLASALPTLIPATAEAVAAIVETLTNPESIGGMVDSAIQLIIALTEGLINAIPKLLESAPKIVANLVTALIQNAPKLLAAAGAVIDTIVTGIANGFSKIIQKGRDLVDKVKEGFMQKVSQAAQWGRDLIQNFIDGILAKWNNLKSTVSNVANTVKSFLGFSEPEKGPLSNFHTFAPDMMELFASGIRSNIGSVKTAITTVADMAANAMNAGLTFEPSITYPKSFVPFADNSGQNATVIERIIAEIVSLRDALASMRVVLDSGETIGFVDSGIARRKVAEERGAM